MDVGFNNRELPIALPRSVCRHVGGISFTKIRHASDDVVYRPAELGQRTGYGKCMLAQRFNTLRADALGQGFSSGIHQRLSEFREIELQILAPASQLTAGRPGYAVPRKHRLLTSRLVLLARLGQVRKLLKGRSRNTEPTEPAEIAVMGTRRTSKKNLPDVRRRTDCTVIASHADPMR